jgi:hypothetical protein
MTENGEDWASPISIGHPVLDALIRTNGNRLGRLAERGVALNLERVMLQHLVEHFFPVREDRQAHELSFQTYLNEVLNDVEAQVDRAQISVPQKSGLIVPQP